MQSENYLKCRKSGGIRGKVYIQMITYISSREKFPETKGEKKEMENTKSDTGYIFVDYTAEGKRIQTVILDCVSRDDAREQADNQLRSMGYVVGGN